MTKRSWICQLFKRPVTHISRRAPRRRRLAVELLEDRWVPSTFVVNNPTDLTVVGETNLRQAINAASGNGVANSITFDPLVFPATQVTTISLTGGALSLTSTHTTTITGTGANQLIVDGHNASRVFNIASGASASLSGLTITAGNSNGGLYDFGSVSLTNCSVSGNHGNGVTLGNGTSASATLSNCIISNNTGTGVFTVGSTLTMNNCTISGNMTRGVMSYVSTLALNDCTLSGNSENFNGGNLFIRLGHNSLTNCTISGNSATGKGGGVVFYVTNPDFLTNCTVSGNTATQGGGIYAFATGGASSSPTLLDRPTE